ncbi:MAG: zf-HC2 domain-containing protein [Planctomycetes bacterium]|nr:zf-HC2 domain-containing protein [Planctomycetota bacterium]
MNCDEAKQMLAGYADGELSPLENDALAAHLEQCGRCRQIVHDQQRVQHVLDQYEPPPVADDQWDAIAQSLRTELAGSEAQTELKTRPRIADLEPTPEAAVAVAVEEPVPPPPPRPAREVPQPGSRIERQVIRGPAPTRIVDRTRPRHRPAPFRWMAHLVGAAAAAAVVLLGLAALWLNRAPPLEPSALARQDDVDIMELRMLDEHHNLVFFAGEADDVAAIWVEPDEPSG